LDDARATLAARNSTIMQLQTIKTELDSNLQKQIDQIKEKSVTDRQTWEEEKVQLRAKLAEQNKQVQSDNLARKRNAEEKLILDTQIIELNETIEKIKKNNTKRIELNIKKIYYILNKP